MFFLGRVFTGALRGVGGDALLPQMLFEGDELQGKKAPGEQVSELVLYTADTACLYFNV